MILYAVSILFVAGRGRGLPIYGIEEKKKKQTKTKPNYAG